MSHYTLKLPFLAVVPVGHRVRVELYRREVGVARVQMQLDPERPVIVDLETGVRWMHLHQQLPHELHGVYFGRNSRTSSTASTSAACWRVTSRPIGARTPARART